ncbi:MAG: hypothetical protein GXP24_07440 [Planctomycetes bacterium]|nr:hypothetical protein [Planctomycetota bacterium]
MFEAPLLSHPRNRHRRLAITLCLLLLAIGGQPALAQFDFGGFGGRSKSAAQVTVESQFTPATADRPALLFVTATIAEGFHIYAIDQGSLPSNGGGPLPTKITIEPQPEVQLIGAWQPLQPPTSHPDEVAWIGLELREHEKQVTWVAPIKLGAGVDPAGLTITGKLIGQACNPQTCVPFETALTAALGTGIDMPATFFAGESPASAETTPANTSLPLLTILGYGVLGGLILNLMPCVLPVIGLKVLSFAEQAGESRSRILMLNLSYVAGLMTVFLVLATLAALAKLGLSKESLGWGELNTLTWFKVSMTALIFSMALSFLGIWELPIPGFATSGKATELTTREGPFGAFCMGMFTTILATPCSGPFLGPVFGFTISQPPSVIYAIFFAVGLGMSLPYLLIGAFPALVSWIPKPGAWMDTLKNLLGFVLLGTVVYLFSTINHDYFIATLSLLFGIWFACWMIGRTPITASVAQRRNAWLEGTAVAAIVGTLAFQFLTPSTSMLPWKPYSPQALAAARAEGNTVMVDFTAQWCPTCKTNLLFAINRSEVKQWVEENNVVTLLADWTDRSEMIKNALRELNSQSIPLLAIYPADATKPPIVLPDLLTKKKVLAALAAADPQASVNNNNAMATKPSEPHFSLRQTPAVTQ